MGPGRKPRKEPGGDRPAGPRLVASMGPGRKPRKELTQEAITAIRALELQWGLGENPGRNRTPCASWPARRARFNGAWAKTQEGTGSHRERRARRRASMGPGRKPRKERGGENEPERHQKPPLQWGLGENPGRNSEVARLVRESIEGLQWGLGENPGRNSDLDDDEAAEVLASMGPGRKPRKELGGRRRRGPDADGASMGPGRKPRKEPR